VAAAAAGVVATGLAVDALALRATVSRALRCTTARSTTDGRPQQAHDGPEPARRPVDGSTPRSEQLHEELVDEEH